MLKCVIFKFKLDFEFSSKLQMFHACYDKSSVLKTMNYVLKPFIPSMKMFSDTPM